MIYGPAHTVADWTVYTKPDGISHSTRDEGSPELADGTEHIFSRIKPDNEHSKAGYGIPSESSVNEEIHELVLLTSVILQLGLTIIHLDIIRHAKMILQGQKYFKRYLATHYC